MEVLTYTESQKADTLNQSGARKYHCHSSSVGRLNTKHEAANKFTKKFGSRDPSLNQRNPKIQKTAVTAGTGQRNSSLIPQPASAQNPNKKTSVQPTPSKKQAVTPSVPPSTSSISKQSGGQHRAGLSCNNSSPNLISPNKEKCGTTKRLSNESLKSDDRIRANNAKNSANTPRLCSRESRVTAMITERRADRAVRPSTPSRKVPAKARAESAQKVLSDQLLRGKVPPKAKFRADDEISIGDSGETGEEPGDAPDKVSMRSEDLYPPSRACLEVARCLEEEGRARENKTNSLPLNSGLCLESERTGKSTSLRDYYRQDRQPADNKGSSTSEGFFQRLSNLRRSFNSHDNKRSGNKIRPHLTASNSPFFQGIAEREKSSGRSKVHHSDSLVILPIIKSYKPPVRKYQFQRAFPIRREGGERLKRSFSFSDAQIIAQSVEDGEGKVISDLYPSFLVSDSVYSLSERTRLVKNDNNPVVSNTSVNSNKCSQVGKDTNSSEQTVNLARSVKGEDDNPEDRRESLGSEVTLTSSIVNIRTVAGTVLINFFNLAQHFPENSCR